MSKGQRQCLLIAGLLLGLLCLAAGPKLVTSNLSRFVSVTVQASASGETLISVVTTESAPYHVFRLEHPKRLVLDLEATELLARERSYAGQGPLVERVRLGQRDDQGSPVVRVVADLKQDYGFDVRHTPNGIEEAIWTGTRPDPAAASAGVIVQPNAIAVPVSNLKPADSQPGSAAAETNRVQDTSAPATNAPAAPTALGTSDASSVSPDSATVSKIVASSSVSPPQPASSVVLAEPQAGAGQTREAALAQLAEAVYPLPGEPKVASLAVLSPNLTTQDGTSQLASLPFHSRISTSLGFAPSINAAQAAVTAPPAGAIPVPPKGPEAGSRASAAPRSAIRDAPNRVASLPLHPPANKSVGLVASAYPAKQRAVTAQLADATPPPPAEPRPVALPPAVSSPGPPILGGALPDSPSPPGQTPKATAEPESPPQTSLGPEVCGAPPYTGERNSFNLKDVDLKDFFRLVHEISGLNVIVDSNVSGTVTLALDNVPWDQALHFVLGNNGLACTVEGNVLRIAKMQTLTDEAKTLPLVTVVRYLHYATASDVNLNNITGSSGGGGVNPPPTMLGIASILKNMGDKILGPGGTVSADPRDNAVVFSCVPKQVPIVQGIIDKLDQKSKQISIEARIVLTTSDVVRQLQTSLNNLLKNGSGTLSGTGSTGSAATGFGTYTITNQTARYLISATVSAAETRNQARTISAPNIVTQNNVPGTVSQGTQIPLQTTINNTVTTVYINATLTLGVTPVVSGDGSVFLNIIVQNNSPGPVIPGTQNPEILTQAATTQVLVPDGGVVVFGGIKLNNNTRSVNQVPGLGAIPIFGHLFKSTNREDQENELLFIVTPKILG